MSGKIWIESELDFLRKNCNNMSNLEIAQVLGKTEASVQLKCHRIGLNKKRPLSTYSHSNIKIGDKNERLEILEIIEKLTKNGNRTFVKCKCLCGKYIEVELSKFTARKSCGCLKLEKSVKNLTTHNLSTSKLYHHWHKMKDRCNNKNSKAYKVYGARGINVCNEWANDFLNFYNWSINNGFKEGLTLDRIDNNKGYFPTNCRWVTMMEQGNNRRNNKKLTAFGETKTVAQWTRDNRCKVGEVTLRRRIDECQNTMTPEEMIIIPPHGLRKYNLHKNLDILGLEP